MYCPCHRRAVALVAVLFTVVICMLMLSVSIRFAGFHKVREVRYKQDFAAQCAAESGIAYVAAFMGRSNSANEVLALNGARRNLDGQQWFHLSLAYKMGFLWVRSRGVVGDREHVAEALLGCGLYDLGDKALIIKESGHEIFVSGKTSLAGDVMVPGGKLTPRALHKLPRPALPLGRGRIGNADQVALPGINPWLVQESRHHLLTADGIQVGLGRLPRDPRWSLEGKTLKFQESLTIPESLTEIRGPGVVLVKGDIKLQGPLHLGADVWLVATGSIESEHNLDLAANLVAGLDLKFKGAVSGIANLVARRILDLPSGTNLRRPSQCAIVKLPELGHVNASVLVIRGGNFAGTLYSNGQEPWSPLIKINERVEARGYIFSQDRLELNAPFSGHIFTKTLQSSLGAQTFSNWLKNIQVERDMTDVNWALPPGFSRRVRVLEWVRR